MQMSATITKISAALLKAQSNMGSATKDAKNPFFKSNYADLNAIREASIPVLNSVGVTVLQPTVVVEGKNYVRTLLLHESGEFLASDTEIVQSKQNDPQAHGSGISYARRYGLQALLNIAAVDDDGEAAMGRGRAATSGYAQTTVVSGNKATTAASNVVTIAGPALPAGSAQTVIVTEASPEPYVDMAPAAKPKKWQRTTKTETASAPAQSNGSGKAAATAAAPAAESEWS